MKLGLPIRIEEDVENNWDAGGFGGAIGAIRPKVKENSIASNEPSFMFVAFQQATEGETDALTAPGQIVITAEVTIEFEISK